MDAQTNQVYVAETEVRKRKWPLYLALGALGAAIATWSIALPVLGVLYLVQLLA